ncbi:MAG TPA: M15 family metallopeptidase [Pyrinomonadaceae bacterium]|nr:M15 family metallopeptidase [Pyrinomonadaceae bacterium]
MIIRLIGIVFFAFFLAACQKSPTDTNTTISKNENTNLVISNANSTETPKITATPKLIKAEIDGKQTELVLAREIVPNLAEDLKYATADNFMKRKLYDDPNCYLLRETAEKLAVADRDLSKRKPGFKLKVWDCYRPMSVQKEMWKEYTNTPYVANPTNARHPRGRAVDITIVDTNGKELEMPTEYDNFTPKAHPNAPTTKNAAINRELLRSVMVAAGFTGVTSEWWHFDNLAKGK